jgi:hypothetical protein
MKEEMLRAFLTDELFVEKGYLKPGEAEGYKWADKRKVKLIEVLKLAIDGEASGEGERITEQKINRHLNVRV